VSRVPLGGFKHAHWAPSLEENPNLAVGIQTTKRGQTTETYCTCTIRTGSPVTLLRVCHSSSGNPGNVLSRLDAATLGHCRVGWRREGAVGLTERIRRLSHPPWRVTGVANIVVAIPTERAPTEGRFVH
jgi:hypothetical protein